MMSQKIWLRPQILDWTQILLDSFNHFLGYQLISRQEDCETQARELFEANFVVVSHGIENDPILNYGNQTALDLWEMNWDSFTQTPSRLTAEPIDRDKRKILLEQVATQGYIDNYSGVRISSTGQRFYIKKTIIWNLVDNSGNECGQAATFSDWQIIA